MTTFLTALHIFVCLFLILVVLLQAGKGGGMGIAFGGGGGSQTVFGSSGAGNFLTRLTSVTAFVFLLTSLGLAHFSSQQDSRRLQRLAERKATEKKADDARAAQLKMDIERARQSAGKPGAGATPAAPDETSMPGAPPAATLPAQAAAKDAAKSASKNATKPAPAPKRRRHAAPSADSAGGSATPAAPEPAPPPASE